MQNMYDEFLLKLAVSFIVGGVWITLVTVAAEKYGSRLGGLFGGLPSTAAVTLLFIGITQSTNVAAEAAAVLPLAMVASGFFAIVYLAFLRRGFIIAYTAALVCWFGAGLVVVLAEVSYCVAIAIWITMTICFYVIVEKLMNISSDRNVRVTYSILALALRAVFSGTVVAGAVLMGKFGGPLYGGVFAAFPAVFTSTFAIAYRTGGIEFSRAVAKSMIVSAMINVSVFAIAVKYLFPSVGLIVGSAAAFAISLLSGVLSHNWVTSRLS
ncbi:MAG: hypothetical protein GY847_14995 [Proteobacteria bacterium]|nr:hypothetical protein [Pseudomonadota bacterium]